MKPKSLFPLSLFVFILLTPIFAIGQITVSKVTDPNAGNTGNGFYYSLPRTMLQIDLTIEKKEQIRGPLAEYTVNYLGTDDFIENNRYSYRVVNINVRPIFEADPNQVFYVQFPTERAKDEKILAFQLSEMGTLLAVDHEPIPDRQLPPSIDQTIIVTEGSDDFQLHPDYNRKKKVDTIRRKITIDTVSIERFIFKTSWVDKSDEDRANEAALQITNLREARFNLLSGYQEVNYGESMKYMDSKLASMEKQYLELFLGKEVKSHESQSVVYTPERNIQNDIILTLPGNANVEISVSPHGNTSLMPQSIGEQTNSVFYRIPEIADIEIRHNGKVIYSEIIPISQLGVVASAPLNNTRTQFDMQTGSLIKIVRE